MLRNESDNELAVKMVSEELDSLREEVPNNRLVKESYFKNEFLAGQNIENAPYRNLMDLWKALLRLRSDLAAESAK